MTIRSSGVGSGIVRRPIRFETFRATASSSKGSAPNDMSASIWLDSWRSNRTRDSLANAMASGMRGANPNRAPSATKSPQRVSSSHTSPSTSLVRRGRPRMDAATPPITIPRTPPARHHRTRSWRADRKGATGSGSETIRFPQLPPTLPHFLFLRGKRPCPAEFVCRSHERCQLAQFLNARCLAQFALLTRVDEFPPRRECSGLGSCHVALHRLSCRLQRWFGVVPFSLFQETMAEKEANGPAQPQPDHIAVTETAFQHTRKLLDWPL